LPLIILALVGDLGSGKTAFVKKLGEELRKGLEKMRAQASNGVLRIRTDDQVPLGQVFQALDIAAKAGIRSIGDL